MNAVVLLVAVCAHAGFDLTGDWATNLPPFGIVRIVQHDMHITFGGLDGVVDPQAGTFAVTLDDISYCPGPTVLQAQATDANHFYGSISGWRPYLVEPICRYVMFDASGTRVTPSTTPVPSPSPTPTRVPCAGDCDKDGRVSISEAQMLVAWLSRPRLMAKQFPTACADFNRNGLIEISELVAVVHNALHGCP